MDQSVVYVVKPTGGYKEFTCPNCGARLFDIYRYKSIWVASFGGMIVSALVGVCPHCDGAFEFGNPKRMIKFEGGTITENTMDNDDD